MPQLKPASHDAQPSPIVRTAQTAGSKPLQRGDLQLIGPALLLLLAGVGLRVAVTGPMLWPVAEGLRWLGVLLLSVFAARRWS
jgi:hypothetical protein